MPATPPQPTKLSFGIELEYVEKSADHDEIASRHGFVSRHDASVRRADGGNGYEMVSPVMFATVLNTPGIPCVTFDEQPVRDLCLLAALVNKSCGLHVHIGKPIARSASKSKWTDAEVHAWLVTGKFLEEDLYAFCPPSRKGNDHAKPISEVYTATDYFTQNPANPADPSKYRNPKRYCWLNIVETARIGTTDVPFEAHNGRGNAHALGTVEIRMLGNTRLVPLVRAWVKFHLQWGAIISTRDPALAISAIVHGGILEPALNELKVAKQSVAAANAQPASGTLRTGTVTGRPSSAPAARTIGVTSNSASAVDPNGFHDGRVEQESPF